MNAELLALLQEFFKQTDTELFALARGWARVLPVVLIVPAFGARMVPRATRAIMGLAIAFVLAPAITSSLRPSEPLVWILAADALCAIPLAISAAGLLWAASMVGAMVNDLRGLNAAPTEVLEADSPALGALLGLFAAAIFLQTNGVVALVGALARLGAPALSPWLGAARGLADAIGVAVGLGLPVIGAVFLWDVAAALIARAASPAYVHSTLAPLRALVVLVALWASSDALLPLLGASP